MKKPVLMLGLALLVAACAPEAEGDQMAEGMHKAAEGGEHDGHNMGTLSDKAVKDKKEAAALLMTRFGVLECEKADLIGSLRTTKPDTGETMMRAYQVPVACAEAATAKVKEAGYTDGGDGLFTGTSADGAAEEVTIKVLEDGTSATIEWKAEQK